MNMSSTEHLKYAYLIKQLVNTKRAETPCIHLLVFALLSFLIWGCTTADYLQKEELHEYLGDEANGLSQSIDNGTVNLRLTYCPSDLMIWREVEDRPDVEAFEQVSGSYNDYLYFTMQLTAGGRDALYGTSVDQADFNEKLQTLSFRLQQYINLTTSQRDTIPLADAHFTRTFGKSSSNDVLLVFSREKTADADWIAINSQEFGFRTGRRSFRFSLEKINNTPKLAELRPFYAIKH